jgi:DNA-binding transcriptional LysR family regulator
LGAASARIKVAELELGTQLLARSRNGVELTEAGEIFLAPARTILKMTAGLEGDMAPFAKGARATVHLLSNTAGLAEHLPRPLARFLRSHPDFDVRVEERESAAIGQLISGGSAELGIAVERAVSPALETFEFCEDKLVIAFLASHRLSGRKMLSFEEVVGLDFVGLPATSALQNHFLGQARKLGKRMRPGRRSWGSMAFARWSRRESAWP